MRVVSIFSCNSQQESELACFPKCQTISLNLYVIYCDSFSHWTWARIVVKVTQCNIFLSNHFLVVCMMLSLLLRGLVASLLCACSLKILFSVWHIRQIREALWESVSSFSCQSYPHALFCTPVMVVWWKEIKGGGAFSAHACLHFTMSDF